MAKKCFWIRDLAPGVYTMQQLIEILKMNRAGIARQLRKHGCEILKQPKNKEKIFNWKGFFENDK